MALACTPDPFAEADTLTRRCKIPELRLCNRSSFCTTFLSQQDPKQASTFVNIRRVPILPHCTSSLFALTLSAQSIISVASMKSSFALFAFVAAAVAQIPGLPSCANSCINLPSQCQITDYKCICTDGSFITNISCCVSKNCGASDQAGTSTLNSIRRSALGD